MRSQPPSATACWRSSRRWRTASRWARDLSRLARFRALGARYLTLTHNGHNALADSCNPRTDLGDAPAEHGGLSPLGRAAIAELNRLGMLVDVAHVSRDTMLQAAELSRTPVVSTHSCIRALCDHPRNMDDAQLDALRDVGGVIQITAVAAFLKRDAKPEAVTVADFADHVDYAVRRIGIEHVGISSDFDGGGGFSGWHDAVARAPTSRPNCCAAATTGRRSPRCGAAISCACCGLPRRGRNDAHRAAAGRDRGAGARPGHLAHGRARRRGEGRGGGAASSASNSA